ncbi:MAG TPA: molybdenum ABC transporter ATP-binding protein [Hypericibacter adhaerens]|uniref:Molybdenum import ATP-binding protein ModC n=1 Tax=Hypericibacter adhaerens TaxID=2602016 RepID=A0A5J6N1W9_9PROT|nr:molybdenum ABC transporter ATP-binding protein [Hypericibacter adhaerens]QEX22580.1 molybdenum import ATP-binding protein ModC [Hypericibacter adhaerens]HWA41904.1 molybdenum ABC transporter ATP-binding protein [Hypericibacter adhaerens]
MTLEVDVALARPSFDLVASFHTGSGVTALFGHSGSGKTTLINMVAGLVRPDRGRILVDGRALFDSEAGIDLPSHRRRVGYVFQESRLFPHLTVRQNLLYGSWFRGRGFRLGSVDQIVELLGIGDLLPRRPSSLSGGEKQRVAIGRAILSDPAILLMDEPLASLDDARKGEILPYLERLRDGLDLPILYVSHSLPEVIRLATTMVVLAEGKVTAAGSVEAVMERSDLFPATGHPEGGSVLEARVAAHDAEFGLTELETAGGVLRVPHLDSAVGSRLRVLVQSRDVMIATERPAHISALNILAGRIATLRDDGHSTGEATILVGGSGSGAGTIRARITRRSIHQLGLAPGREVFAVVKTVAIDDRSIGHYPGRPGRKPEEI